VLIEHLRNFRVARAVQATQPVGMLATTPELRKFVMDAFQTWLDSNTRVMPLYSGRPWEGGSSGIQASPKV